MRQEKCQLVTSGKQEIMSINIFLYTLQLYLKEEAIISKLKNTKENVILINQMEKKLYYNSIFVVKYWLNILNK